MSGEEGLGEEGDGRCVCMGQVMGQGWLRGFRGQGLQEVQIGQGMVEGAGEQDLGKWIRPGGGRECVWVGTGDCGEI